MDIAIRRRLTTDEFLCSLLARFGDEAAIFYRKAPADTDLEENYPHVIFSVDKFSDPQKGVAGILTVDIISSQMHTAPEEIERPLRERLEGVFLRPQSGEIFSLKWQRSDIFSEPVAERAALIIGVTMMFEIYEFPLAETNAPDPVEALNHWATGTNAVIIGVTEFEEFFEPTREQPAIYFDVERIRLVEQSNSKATFDATINLHVFAPDVRSRREWLANLNHELALLGTVFANDGSPMFLQNSEYLWAASEVQGQIQFIFRYAVTRRYPYAHPMIEAKFATGAKIRRFEDVHDKRIDFGSAEEFRRKPCAGGDGVKDERQIDFHT